MRYLPGRYQGQQWVENLGHRGIVGIVFAGWTYTFLVPRCAYGFRVGKRPESFGSRIADLWAQMATQSVPLESSQSDRRQSVPDRALLRSENGYGSIRKHNKTNDCCVYALLYRAEGSQSIQLLGESVRLCAEEDVTEIPRIVVSYVTA